LLYATGCRNSEILHFTTDNLKELCSTREFSLDNNNKTKTTRLLHFSNSIISKLQDIQIDTTRKYLFYKNGTDRPISISGFNKLLNDTIKKTLGPLYSTHSFRKGLVTDIINTTGNIKLAQKIAGHSSSNTTAIYIQADDNDVRNSLEAVR
jgi:integrase